MNTRCERLVVLFVAAGMCCAGCGGGKTETVAAAPLRAATPPSAPPAAPAATATATAPEDVLIVSGPLIVEHQVDVTAQRDGIVATIAVDTDRRVKAGTLLGTLDGRQLTANLEAARAKARSIQADLKNWESEAQVLQADYGRAQKLWNEGLIAEEQLQHAKYKAESDQWDVLRVQEQLNTARQDERSLELELEKTRVTAPFDGLVARRYIRAGQNVVKGDRLFWVTAEAPLLVRFTLPERFVGHLQAGQLLSVTSPDLPQEKHTAKIKEVSAVVDPSSGTIEVLAELLRAPASLRPGMTADIHIQNPR
jgi:RND family efflux transporter MFP subunit